MIDCNGAAQKVHGIGLKSANDCPHRDPDSAKVFIFDDARKTFIHVSTLALAFGERFETTHYKIPSSTTSAVLIELHNNKAREI